MPTKPIVHKRTIAQPLYGIKMRKQILLLFMICLAYSGIAQNRYKIYTNSNFLLHDKDTIHKNIPVVLKVKIKNGKLKTKRKTICALDGQNKLMIQIGNFQKVDSMFNFQVITLHRSKEKDKGLSIVNYKTVLNKIINGSIGGSLYINREYYFHSFSVIKISNK